MRNSRLSLLKDYLEELQTICDRAPDNRRVINFEEYVEEAKGETNTQWIDVIVEENIIGFLIIGRDPNCHPLADCYIQEAYIIPEYRRKGIMTRVVRGYVKKNKGKYCMFVIDTNVEAKEFWNNVFNTLDYEPYNLGDEFEMEGCSQFGFRPKHKR